MTQSPNRPSTLTGIERKQIEEAQAKLKQARYEREHFSDGVPVAIYDEYHSQATK